MTKCNYLWNPKYTGITSGLGVFEIQPNDKIYNRFHSHVEKTRLIKHKSKESV